MPGTGRHACFNAREAAKHACCRDLQAHYTCVIRPISHGLLMLTHTPRPEDGMGMGYSSRLTGLSTEAARARPGSREVPPRLVGEEGRPCKPKARAPFFTEDLYTHGHPADAQTATGNTDVGCARMCTHARTHAHTHLLAPSLPIFTMRQWQLAAVTSHVRSMPQHSTGHCVSSPAAHERGCSCAAWPRLSR